MTILGGVGIAVFVVLFSLYLKPQQKELSVLFVICGTLILFALALSKSGEALQFIRDTMELSAFSEEMGIMCKALGIAVIAQIGADICREAGESVVATQVELVGKAEILLLSLPLVTRIMTLIREMLT